MNPNVSHTLNKPLVLNKKEDSLEWNFFDITIFLHFFLPSYVLFTQPFEFYITYTFIILYLPFLVFKYQLPRGVWWILIILLLTGILNVWLDNNTYKNFFKIYLNIAVNLVFYGTVMAYYNFNVEEMFRRYLKGAVIVSIFGILQIIDYKLGTGLLHLSKYGFTKWSFSPGGVLGLRINATYPEPTHFAQFISPAMFISVYNLFFLKEVFIKRWESTVILTAFILASSALGYAGFFIALIIFLINFGLVRYIFFFVPIGLLLFYVLYKNVEDFKARMDGIVLLFVEDYLAKEEEKEITSKQGLEARQYRILKDVHGSALSLYNNYYIAFQNFKSNPLFGTGLGSHESASQKYSLYGLIPKWYLINTKDANSMGLRIISELGLMGIIFTILFLKNGFVIRSETDTQDTRWLISGALFTIIALQLLRNGNYTFAGFFFFCWLYYYNNFNNEKNEDIKEAHSAN